MINDVSWVSFSQGSERDDPLSPIWYKRALEKGEMALDHKQSALFYTGEKK